MNPHDLKNLAERASSVEGRASERLTEVHARILTARRRRAATAAAGTAGVIAVIVAIVAVIAPGTRAVVAPVEPAVPNPSCTTLGQPNEAPSPGRSVEALTDHVGDLPVQPLAGTPGKYGWVDGNGADARFESIDDMAVGPTGAVYVSDYSQSEHRSRIRMVTPAGQVTTMAGLDASKWYDGFGAITVDSCGTVYAAVGSSTIRRVGPQSKLVTLAGDPAAPSFDGTEPPGTLVDGVGTEARFGVILRMAAAPSGDLYVTDAGTVRKVTPQGKVTTVPTCPASVQDCLGWPGTIAVAPDGVIYIGSDDYVLRTIAPGGEVSVLATGDQGGTGLFHRMSIAYDAKSSILMALDTEGLHAVTQGRATAITTTGRDLRWSGHLAIGADGTVYVADQSSIVVIRRT